MSILLRLADALNQDDATARSLNILLAVAAGLLTHAVGLWFGRGLIPDALPWFAPGPWIAAVIWLFILALLGGARWMLNSYTIIGVATARTMVTVLILCCLLWPFYSPPFADPRLSLLGNAVTMALALATITVVRRRSIESAALVMPVTVWLAFWTLVMVLAVGWL